MSHSRRSGLFGLGFIVLDLIRTPVLGRIPLPGARKGEVFDFYATSGARVTLSALMLAAAMVLALAFFAALRDAAPEADTPLLFGSVLVVVAIDLARAAMLSAIALRASDLGPELVLGIHVVITLLGGTIGFPLAAGIYAFGRAARGSPELPPWLPGACTVMAGAWLVSGARIATDATWAWAAGASVFVAFAVFVLALCVWLLRREPVAVG